MAEVLLSIKFPDEDPLSLVLESGGDISGGSTMSIDSNQIVKENIGASFTMNGTTLMSLALLEKLDYFSKLSWNEGKTATLLYKIVNGEEVIISRFFRKAIFTQMNMIEGVTTRGEKVTVQIDMSLSGEQGYHINTNSL